MAFPVLNLFPPTNHMSACQTRPSTSVYAPPPQLIKMSSNVDTGGGTGELTGEEVETGKSGAELGKALGIQDG